MVFCSFYLIYFYVKAAHFYPTIKVRHDMEGSFLKRRDINLVQLVVGILFFVVAITFSGPPCLAQEAIKQGPQPAPAAAPPPAPPLFHHP